MNAPFAVDETVCRRFLNDVLVRAGNDAAVVDMIDGESAERRGTVHQPP